LIFRKAIVVSVRFLFCIFLAGATLRLHAAELKAESARAWEDFVSSKEARVTERHSDSPGRRLAVTPEMRSRLQTGEIIVQPAGKNGAISVPGALIHDWIGTVFVPNTSLGELLARVRDYEKYPHFYRPLVVSAKLRVRHPNSDRYSLVIRQNVLTVKTGLDGNYRSEYHQLDNNHWYSVTRSERLQEISKFGGEDQTEFAPGLGSGFIWRIYSSAKYEAADGGVYIELEAMALSRPIPRSLAWLANPIVERISRSALMTTLRQTRDAQTEAVLTASIAK
jgi:hypothetical protein